MEFFLFWLILSILVGVFAGNNGRSGFGYFLLAMILSPLLGFFIALLAGKNEVRVEADILSSGSGKKCPFCAEMVKIEAVICKHCGREFPEAPTIL